MIRSCLGALVLLIASVTGARADTAPDLLPAKSILHFHLTEALSSDKSTTGQHFSFVMLDPIVIDGKTLVASGTVGSGTLLLAGHAGTSGHEGDLTLRLDSIPTVDGRQLVFDDQRLYINGKNKKMMAGLLGFIPYAGMGARFIRGAEIRIDPKTLISTTLERQAIAVDALPQQPVAVTPMPAGSQHGSP